MSDYTESPYYYDLSDIPIGVPLVGERELSHCNWCSAELFSEEFVCEGRHFCHEGCATRYFADVYDGTEDDLMTAEELAADRAAAGLED